VLALVRISAAVVQPGEDSKVYSVHRTLVKAARDNLRVVPLRARRAALRGSIQQQPSQQRELRDDGDSRLRTRPDTHDATITAVGRPNRS